MSKIKSQISNLKNTDKKLKWGTQGGDIRIMEYSELFSRKFGLRPTPQGLIYDKVPETAKIGLFHLILESLKYPGVNYSYYRHLYLKLCQFFRINVDWSLTYDFQYANSIERIVTTSKWDQFYEICQISYSYMKETESPTSAVIKPGAAKMFQEQVNALFKDEFLGFEIKEGRVEKLGTALVYAQIKEARVLLKEPEFKSTDELFEKAIKSFNERPNPDVENCIKDSVAAIESIGKIIVENDKAKIDEIIKSAVTQNVIPKLLGDTIIKLYAYRGNEPAIAHGGIEPSKVSADEAELVLAMSAAMIIYLVKKRSKLSDYHAPTQI